MCDSIRHRGPDDAGYWVDEKNHFAFGHRRLSILDLSPSGAQPMASASGRWMVAFNGEIYNHLELRRKLERCGYTHTWRGHSDTETLLAGFDLWGISETIRRSIGMFALAVWDRQERRLTLIRDRLGEKPLYYGWQGSGSNATLLFGSELKALKAHPSFIGEVDRGSVSLLLRHSCIPAPYSIYTGIAKLPPGHFLELEPRHFATATLPQPRPFWSLVDVAKAGATRAWRGSKADAIEQLDVLLRDVVRQQMIADVPVGAFLSGGIDSSTVVALMQAQSSRPVKTFSIGFREQGYDEAAYAKHVASHLGTDHTEYYVSPQEALALVPRLPDLYDEPFSDSSQIPTFLVSLLARRHVTVSLSGDGGDELFCGYNRYKIGSQYWNRMRNVPASLRRMAGRAITSVSPDLWNRLAACLGKSHFSGNIGDKLHKFAGVLGCTDEHSLYMSLVSHWTDPLRLVVNGYEPPTMLTGLRPDLDNLSSVQRMMVLDALSYLPDDILVKLDRASMGVSLESRIPFLDHRVVELAWQMPQELKLSSGQGKWILRQVLFKYVNRELLDRPKMGFGVPLDSWLRGPLRDWAEGLLNESRLRQEGFFHPDEVRKKWSEHLSGRRNWQYCLWDVLMFQSWLERERLC